MNSLPIEWRDNSVPPAQKVAFGSRAAISNASLTVRGKNTLGDVYLLCTKALPSKFRCRRESVDYSRCRDASAPYRFGGGSELLGVRMQGGFEQSFRDKGPRWRAEIAKPGSCPIKTICQILEFSPRRNSFHRPNILKPKLECRNTAGMHQTVI